MADGKQYYDSNKLLKIGKEKVAIRIFPRCMCPKCYYRAIFVGETDNHYMYYCPVCDVKIAITKCEYGSDIFDCDEVEVIDHE